METDEIQNLDKTQTSRNVTEETVGEQGNEKIPEDLENYKEKYRMLKRKLKCLLYEQECFHEELRKVQRKCLRVNRDKSFLLDRLLQYEKPDFSSSDSESTDSSSDDEIENTKMVTTTSEANNTSKQANPATNKTESQVKTNKDSPSEKVRCKKIENNKQCTKLVSVKVKSGICYAHRQQLSAERQSQSKAATPSPVSSQNKSATSTPARHGGKDIGQIREAMEASSRLKSASPGYDENDDDLVIDLP